MGLMARLRRKSVKNNVREETVSFAQFQQEIQNRDENYEPRNLSGVYQCIELISNTFSKLPFFAIDNKTKEHLKKAKLYRLLNLQPNSKMNAAVFKKTLITNLLIYGNAYALPKRKGLEVVSIEILDSEKVNIVKLQNDNIQYEYTNPNTKDISRYRYDEIIHLKLNANGGIKGISPLTYARLTTGVGLKQEKFQESFYENGGRPDGVLKTNADLSSKKMKIKDSKGKEVEVSLKEEMRNQWKLTHSGSNNRFNVAILDNGLEYQTIPQISPADMDFVNSKQTNIEDICRYFNVPPYKLGVGKQTYSNNEQANIEYITNTIVPLVNQVEQEYTLKVLLEKEIQDEIMIKCNIEAELRGDTGARATWYKQMQSCGVYSINEMRALENLPDIKYGDARLIGANSTPLELLVKGSTPAETTPNPLTEKKQDQDKDQEQETEKEPTDEEAKNE